MQSQHQLDVEMDKQNPLNVRRSEVFLTVQWTVEGIFSMLFFGYAALGYTNDPRSCIASDEVQRRIVVTDGNRDYLLSMPQYTDVGESLRAAFEVGFVASTIMFIAALIHIIVKTKYIRVPARLVAVICYFTMFGCLITALVIRYSKTGKVCAGDYLNEDEPSKGYLIE